MKSKTILIFSLFLIFLLLSSGTIQACSGFMVKNDDQILIAHNKDWWSPDTTIQVYPAEKNAYARLFFEIPYPHMFNNEYKVLAGGINEKGLCYESFVTPVKPASFELFKPPIFTNSVDRLLQEYATVEEVVNFIESHNLFFVNYILRSGQLFVVDRTGDAAIIEGDDIIRIQHDYQICTNFLQSSPGLGNYPCWRYTYLTEKLTNTTNPNISDFEHLLNHVQLFTQYSWIYNPNKDTIHLYHFHDYENGITLNLTEEFNQPAHTYYLPSLFEPTTNTPPKKPSMPTGPLTGWKDTEYIFETNTTDDDNSQQELYYKWDFGDGTETFWIHNNENYSGMIRNTWKRPGTYEIRVKAKDIYGKESNWSNPLEIVINRRPKLFFPTFLTNLIE